MPIISPFGSGKTTLMRAVQEQDERFGRMRGFTTRPPRIVDEAPDTYHYLPHDNWTLTNIYRAVKAQALAQYAVHPTGKVYGSTVDAYAYPNTMIDMLASGTDQLKRLPFKSISTFFVAVEPQEWRSRADARLQITSASEHRKRIVEGIGSIEWGLEQGEDMQWILNSGRPVTGTAAELIERTYEPRIDRVARHTGELLLGELRSML